MALLRMGLWGSTDGLGTRSWMMDLRFVVRGPRSSVVHDDGTCAFDEVGFGSPRGVGRRLSDLVCEMTSGDNGYQYIG